MSARGSVHHAPKREREKPVVTRANCPECGLNVPVRNDKIMMHPECSYAGEVK